MSKPGKAGLKRMLAAVGYSCAGLRWAWRKEAAFRQEVLLVVIFLPAGLILGESGVERALLVGSLLLVLCVELINSAIEAVVDRVSGEHHALAGAAKDLGSAAVLVALINVVAVWALVLLGDAL